MIFYGDYFQFMVSDKLNIYKNKKQFLIESRLKNKANLGLNCLLNIRIMTFYLTPL